MRCLGIVGCVALVALGCQGEDAGSLETAEQLVCGVDGKTYTVVQAAEHDHPVAHRGDCEEPMRCASVGDCPEGDSCEDGVCVPESELCVCPTVYDPVCGSDGVTYGNACAAACAGVQLVEEDLCDECAEDEDCEPDEICVDFAENESAFCGWVGCDSDEQCRPGEVCVITEVCIAPAVSGTCEAYIPRWFHNAQTGQCEEFIWGGCDGNGNNFETKEACEAACPNERAEKLSLAQRTGECRRDLVCPEDLFAPEIYAPVCGIDGETYSNPCHAEREGVIIAYDGECIVEVDCLTQGCPDDWSCDDCQTRAGARYICLSPLAGSCVPPSAP